MHAKVENQSISDIKLYMYAFYNIYTLILTCASQNMIRYAEKYMCEIKLY